MDEVSKEKQWIIVGGGIHGAHIAVRLVRDAGVAPDEIAIVDPNDSLLDRWIRCTSNTGMSHLRSPAVHNLDVRGFSLERFARRRRASRKCFRSPYRRPALELFNLHARFVLADTGVDRCHVRGLVDEVTLECDGARARLDDGRVLSGRNLVVSIGMTELHWPDWAVRLKDEGAAVNHVFDEDFVLRREPGLEHTLVIGGGITAAQVALRVSHWGLPVTVCSPHDMSIHQFDSDPGWVGPRFLRGFHAEPDLNERRRMIADARHRGSIPPRLARALKRAIGRGAVRWVTSRIEEASFDGRCIAVGFQGEIAAFDAVVLATGFGNRCPGGGMIENLARSYSLPCADCGYPMVDTSLRWQHPRLYLTGGLAELELGPAARNIVGARHAGDRIVRAIAA